MITHTCGHTSNRRPRNPKTREFLEGRDCGPCLVIGLIEKFGAPDDVRFLSKKQSRWLRDVVNRELSRDVPVAREDRLRIGSFSIARMGRAFAANGNGEVIHVCRERD